MASRRIPDRVTVFAHVPDPAEGQQHFVPAGLLDRKKAAAGRQTVSFAYGTGYAMPPEAFEMDPHGRARRMGAPRHRGPAERCAQQPG